LTIIINTLNILLSSQMENYENPTSAMRMINTEVEVNNKYNI